MEKQRPITKQELERCKAYLQKRADDNDKAADKSLEEDEPTYRGRAEAFREAADYLGEKFGLS